MQFLTIGNALRIFILIIAIIIWRVIFPSREEPFKVQIDHGRYTLNIPEDFKKSQSTIKSTLRLMEWTFS